ncbi:MAG TPA: hypothetical protein VFO65_11615, partial [Acidimicrobiales bacterium]|nr:hypothetical protein [Acidimicrobiales bacterium]
GAAPTDQGAGGPAEGAAIVLLSDGVTTVGRDTAGAARAAAAAGIPVTTIAFGTDDGTVTVAGRTIPVPADPDAMAAVAEATSGRYFEAFSGEELASVYEDIRRRVGYEIEERDAGGALLAGATVLLTAALGLSCLWNGRIA